MNGAGNLRILDRAGPPFLRAAAPVNLDVIETPLRELQEILVVMTLAAGIQVLRAGVGVHAATVTTGVGVDPGLQAQAVNVGGDIGHVAIFLTRLNGRPLLGIDDDVACGIALSQPPAFVDDDILVTGFLHAVRGQGFGLLLNDLRIHDIGETIPGIPAHRRGAEARGCRYEK